MGPIVTGIAVAGGAYLLLKGAKAKAPAGTPVPTPASVQGATAQTPVGVTAPATKTLSAPATTAQPKTTSTSLIPPATVCKTCTSTNTSGLPSTQEQRYVLSSAVLSGAKIVY